MGELKIKLCIQKYKDLFKTSTEHKGKTRGEGNIENKLLVKEKCDEFERFFFIQMNNAIFDGEYLGDDYIKEIKDFENLLVVGDNEENEIYRSNIRFCLINLRDVVFSIQSKIEHGNEDFLVSLTTEIKPNREVSYKYFGFFIIFSLNLLYLDHSLIDSKDYREYLIRIINQIQAELCGLDNEELTTVFKKLKSKCSFLLKKTFIKDKKRSLHYSVDYVVKNVDDVIENDEYNESFSSLFDDMYLERYGTEIVSKYKEDFESEKYSAIGFIILAYYYRISDAKDENRLTSLCSQFDEYFKSKKDTLCKYDKYAFRSIENFIRNCVFSYKLDSEGYKVKQLENDIKEIKNIQERTGFHNYHPFKKALRFLDGHLSCYDSIEGAVGDDNDDFIRLYNYVFEQYKITYEKCIQKHFCPFQLPIEESKTSGKIFFASAFSKPISPKKLKNAERDYRETKQYLKIRQRLIAREKEITKVSEQFQSFRKESFEYLGIFITIITFLFGSIQLFGNDKMKLEPVLLNIASLGIVLAMFMALLYIVLYCNRFKICLLLIFILVCVAVLCIFSGNLS